MSDSWKVDRIGSALDGTNPTILARLSSSFAAIGDVQFLPGYSVLLSASRADRLLDLPRQRRRTFLADMDLLGEAVHIVCSERDPAFHRINYEIHGNRNAVLHAHIWPRYDWEPEEHRTSPVSTYPPRIWVAPDSQLGPQHDGLRAQLILQINRLLAGGTSQ